MICYVTRGFCSVNKHISSSFFFNFFLRFSFGQIVKLLWDLFSQLHVLLQCIYIFLQQREKPKEKEKEKEKAKKIKDKGSMLQPQKKKEKRPNNWKSEDDYQRLEKSKG